VSDDLITRLRKRAEIRRQISTRKSVQEGKPDRIADLLEEAADALEALGRQDATMTHASRSGNSRNSAPGATNLEATVRPIEPAPVRRMPEVSDTAPLRPSETSSELWTALDQSDRKAALAQMTREAQRTGRYFGPPRAETTTKPSDNRSDRQTDGAPVKVHGTCIDWQDCEICASRWTGGEG
jgi:hypothetical protein